MSNTVINVVVARKNPVIVTRDDTGTGEAVTLKNTPVLLPTGGGGGGGAETVIELLDVASNGSIANGSTLVYSAANATFVVEPLPFPDLVNLDCGSFD